MLLQLTHENNDRSAEDSMIHSSHVFLSSLQVGPLPQLLVWTAELMPHSFMVCADRSLESVSPTIHPINMSISLAEVMHNHTASCLCIMRGGCRYVCWYLECLPGCFVCGLCCFQKSCQQAGIVSAQCSKLGVIHVGELECLQLLLLPFLLLLCWKLDRNIAEH